MAQDLLPTPQIQEPLTLQKLNDQLRKIWTQINGLIGRNAQPQILDSLGVNGSIRASGNVSASSLSLGDLTIAPISKDLDPDVAERYKSQALGVTNNIGVPLDLLSHGSPFVWTLRDEFLGGDNATSGNIGDLGWQFTGFAGFTDVGEVGHPGVLELASSGGLGDASFLSSVATGDIRYMAALIKLVGGATFRFGLLESPTSGGATSSGVYFFSNGGSWRAVSRQPSLATTTVIGEFAPVPDLWYLLEIVLNAPLTGSGIADFYINRVGVARHSAVSVSGSSIAFPTFAADGDSVVVDRFVMTGQPRMTLWS